MAEVSIVLFESLTSGGVTTPLASAEYKGVGYYGRSDGIHTVQYGLTNGFVGTIEIQGTLATIPTADDWAVIADATYTTAVPVSDSLIFNFTGNFTWVRAVITDFTAGDINRVLYSHN